MAASSPYQNNDYAALSTFRPYRLPVNDIFKANTALNAYWDQGASAINESYNNVLELNLLSTDNKQIRDKFIQDSQKEITKISAMNVADPSIQRMGKNIFSPIMKDQEIVGEDFTVRNNSSEAATAEQFRTKDGGKFYNPLSADNIQYERNLLSKDPAQGGLNNRKGWRAIANNQSKYVPYSDTGKEYKQIMETVKANEIQKATAAGYSIYETSTKGVSKEDMAAAIQEMGSPQLKAQIGVEARNVYYKKLEANPETVDDYYKGLAKSWYDTKINELTNQKAEIDYNMAMTPKDSKDPEVKARNQKFLDNAKVQSDNATKMINTMETEDKPKYMAEFQGLYDVNNLSTNLSKVEQLWQSSSMDRMAGTLAYESRIEKILPNTGFIAQETNALAYQRLQLDYDRLAEDIRNNKYTGETGRINALKTDSGKGTDGSGNLADPEMENAANSNGTTNLTQTSDPSNPTLLAERAQAVRNLSQGDEPYRQVGLQTILGNTGYAAIEYGIKNNDQKVGVALMPHELEKAGEMMRAYANRAVGNGNTLSVTSQGVTFKRNQSPDYYTNALKNMTSSQFKVTMGEIVKQDPEFLEDLITKTYGQEGPKAAANFKATINTTLRDQTNMAKNIHSKLPAALGDYAQYFKDGGKTLLSDKAIGDAYAQMASKGENVLYFKRSATRPYNTGYVSGATAIDALTGLVVQSTVKFGEETITKAEYNAMTPAQRRESGAGLRALESGEFNTQVRKVTDPIYAKVLTEVNLQQRDHFYNPKNKTKKMADINSFISQMPQSAGSDMQPEFKAEQEFLRANAEHIVSFHIVQPNINEPLPKIRFQFEAGWASGDNKEALEKMASSVSNKSYPINLANPKFHVRPDQNGFSRNREATIVVAPFKAGNGKMGSINIVNASAQPSLVEPVFVMEGELIHYFKNRDGKWAAPKSLTESDIKQAYKLQNNGRDINQALQSPDGPSDVNEFLAAYTNMLNNNRREFELENKKK